MYKNKNNYSLIEIFKPPILSITLKIFAMSIILMYCIQGSAYLMPFILQKSKKSLTGLLWGILG